MQQYNTRAKHCNTLQRCRVVSPRSAIHKSKMESNPKSFILIRQWKKYTVAIIIILLQITVIQTMIRGSILPEHFYGSVVVSDRVAWHLFTGLEKVAKGENLKWGKKNEKINIVGALGLASYKSENQNIYIDYHAISDPLSARLPVNLSTKNQKGKNNDPIVGFRPGHLNRKYPTGYIESIDQDYNLILDHHTATLYNDILLLTRCAWFTKERWKAILRQIRL